MLNRRQSDRGEGDKQIGSHPRDLHGDAGSVHGCLVVGEIQTAEDRTVLETYRDVVVVDEALVEHLGERNQDTEDALNIAHLELALWQLDEVRQGPIGRKQMGKSDVQLCYREERHSTYCITSWKARSAHGGHHFLLSCISHVSRLSLMLIIGKFHD